MIGVKLGLHLGSNVPTLLHQALSTIRRNGGTLIGIPDNFAGTYTDSTGTTPVTAVGDVIGKLNDRVGTNNATQPTTASKPLVAVNAQGKKVISFDGSNDFLQTDITTGNEGWFCAGVTPANTTTAMSVANAGEGTATIPGVWLFSSGGSWTASAADGSSRTNQAAAMQGASPQFVSMGWNASSLLLGVNGTELTTPKVGTGSWSSGANVLRFGLYQGSSIPFNGPLTAIIYTPVLPSAADRALIRKWVGSLQGQTL